MYVISVPSVLWRCWLGGRKGIRPVKNLGGCVGGGTVSPVGVVPTRTVPSQPDCRYFHYVPLLHKNPEDRRWGNPAWTQHSPMLRQKAEHFFWYRPTRFVPEQRPLNGCCCCMYVCNFLCMVMKGHNDVLRSVGHRRCSRSLLLCICHVIGYT